MLFTFCLKSGGWQEIWGRGARGAGQNVSFLQPASWGGNGVEILLKCTSSEIAWRTRCQQNTHTCRNWASENEKSKNLLFRFTCSVKANLCPSVSTLQTAGLPTGNLTVLALTLHPACFGSSLFLPESYFSGHLPALKLNL